jgi:hypothetical protein
MLKYEQKGDFGFGTIFGIWLLNLIQTSIIIYTIVWGLKQLIEVIAATQCQ